MPGLGRSLGLTEIIALCEKILPFYYLVFCSLFVAKYGLKRLFAQYYNALKIPALCTAISGIHRKVQTFERWVRQYLGIWILAA